MKPGDITSERIDYRPAPPPKLRHSMLGIAGFVISLLVPFMLLLQRLYNLLIDGHSEDYWLKVHYRASGPIFIIAIYMLFPIGLVCAALGAMRRGFKRRLALVACVINAIVLVTTLAWAVGMLP